MQEKLCRFTHGADEQQEPDNFEGRQFGTKETDRRCGEAIHLTKDRRKIDAIGQQEQRHDAQYKPEITDTVYNERLHSGRTRGGFTPVETDQKIRRNAYTLPSKEHLDQVIRCYQHQHRERKEAEVCEETRLVRLTLAPLRIVIHVAKGIQVNQRGNRRDNDQHDVGQHIHADRPVSNHRATVDPASNRNDFKPGVGTDKGDPAQQCGQHYRTGREVLRPLLRNNSPAEACDDRRN